MWMLDTDTCVFLIRARSPALLARLRQEDPAEVLVSSITAAELAYGAARSSRPEQNRDALAQLLAVLTVAPFDDLAASAYGEVRARLERAGTPIGSMDTLIAAHALNRGCTLVIHNTREFERVAGLRFEDWVKEG